MSEESQFDKGRKMLEEVTLHYAGDHGLRPQIEWVDFGFEWTLKATDALHTVRVVFSPDEIEMFTEELPENRATKLKIRNAFASLSM